MALEVAARRSNDAQALYEAAWLTIVRPTGTSELNAQALSGSRPPARMAAGDPDRLAEYQHILCLALFRAGRSDEALQLVTRLGASPTGQARARRPIDVAVTALASQKLGRFADAPRRSKSSNHWSIRAPAAIRKRSASFARSRA